MRDKFDSETLLNLIDHIDRSPAVTWTGKGGVKGRIQIILETLDKDRASIDEVKA